MNLDFTLEGYVFLVEEIRVGGNIVHWLEGNRRADRYAI